MKQKETRKTSDSSNTSEQKHEKPEEAVNLLNTEHGTYLTAIARVRNPITGQAVEFRILLDTGSAGSYITYQAADVLKLPRSHSRTMPISVFASDQVHHLETQQVHFQIESAFPNLNVFADTTPIITNYARTFNLEQFKETYKQYAHLTFANPGQDEPISILLGNDYLFHVLLTEAKQEVYPGLFLINSIFGWLLVGRTSQDANQPVPVMLATSAALTSLWSLDTLGIKDSNLSVMEEEEQALKQFYQNIQYDEGRYAIALPWREYPPVLPHNFGLAKGCLMSLLKRYANQPVYLEACEKIFQQQIETDIIEEIPFDHKFDDTHYLPFHLVLQEEKTTPIRIVYNGSAKTCKQNKSINDCLYKGKNLLGPIPGILMRFQTESIGVIGDIEKEFHQITICERDRDYLRFLWPASRDKLSTEKLRVFRFKRIPFGLISSPFLSAATIRYHLQRENPKFRNQLERDLYVDNVITSTESVRSATELHEVATQVFQRARMNLRLWNSNSLEVLNNLPENHRDYTRIVSVLGLKWDTVSDQMFITVPKLLDPNQPVTLRRVLKSVAQLYDPNGWFSPVFVRAKIFLRKIHGPDWDASISAELTEEFHTILADLQELQNIPRPRCPRKFSSDSYDFQLHCFSDASQHALATVIYLRAREKNTENVTIQLVFAKARVAPRKLTIPKLELLAALLATRSIQFVRNELSVNLSETQYLWVDSKCVLHWLKSEKILPTFVTNRIREIKTVSQLEFRYVPSQDNAADLPSRGISTANIKDSSLWWNGPVWLSKNEEMWPAPLQEREFDDQPSQLQFEDESPNKAPGLLTIPDAQYKPFDIQPEKYSTLMRLLRVTAFCIRYVRSTKIAKNLCIFQDSQKSSLLLAKELWIRAEQKNHFGDVLECLRKHRKHSLISRFRLWIDHDGIIRCRGRFEHAPVSEAEKNPILLPRASQSQFTQLLILFVHVNNHHPGTNYTLTAIRRQFWLLRGRAEVYHTIHKCAACNKQIARPFKQPERSNLPTFRLQTPEFPFKKVGIDTFGHFYIGEEKKWVLIVTCLITRAVALEDLDDLTTQTLALAIRRVRARRAAADFYLSDNMPQFKLLQKLIQEITTDQFTWKFTKDYAPWEGATYERLIAVVKTSIYRSFRQFGYIIGPLQFRTLLVEIEAAVNDRPLTAITEDKDHRPLTPNDFLKVYWELEENEPAIPKDLTDAGIRLQKVWIKQKQVLDYFWHEWNTAYLQFLRERSATQNFRKKAVSAAPKKGDIVLVEEANLRRERWKMGIIEDPVLSEDGQIRAATVRLANGFIITRPVQQLYSLELAANTVITPEEFSQRISSKEDEPNTTSHEDPDNSDEFEIDSVSVEEIYEDEEINT